MVGRACNAVRADGRLCRATPMRDSDFCFWHNPETQEEAAEARRLGGARRRREKLVASAYEVAGLASADQLLRVLEIATIDTLGLENSVARSRTLISAVLAGAKLLEIGELQTRIQLLEAAVRLRPDQAAGGLGGGLLGEA